MPPQIEERVVPATPPRSRGRHRRRVGELGGGTDDEIGLNECFPFNPSDEGATATMRGDAGLLGDSAMNTRQGSLLKRTAAPREAAASPARKAPVVRRPGDRDRLPTIASALEQLSYRKLTHALALSVGKK